MKNSEHGPLRQVIAQVQIVVRGSISTEQRCDEGSTGYLFLGGHPRLDASGERCACQHEAHQDAHRITTWSRLAWEG